MLSFVFFLIGAPLLALWKIKMRRRFYIATALKFRIIFILTTLVSLCFLRAFFNNFNPFLYSYAEDHCLYFLAKNLFHLSLR